MQSEKARFLEWQLISYLRLVSYVSNVSLHVYDNNLINLCLASSCDVERGFSRGGLTVSKLRHALSEESTRATTILNAWAQIPGLIPHTDIIQAFKDKCRRLNGKEKDITMDPIDVDIGDSEMD